MKLTGIFAVIMIEWIGLSSIVFGYSGGTGEPGAPYQIANVNDLLQLAAATSDYTKYFILTGDIDLDLNLPGGQVFTSAVIAPDTSTSGGFQGTQFGGTFDGNGHVLYNLTIAASTQDYVGLFGKIDQGQIENLRLENVDITGCNYVGGLAGYISNGSISNCYLEGAAVGNNSLGMGGLAGFCLGSTIADCRSDVNLGGTGSNVGGLAGSSTANSTISNCTAAGNITINDSNNSGFCVGGLVGNNCGSTITHCLAMGDAAVISTSTADSVIVTIGGLAGEDRYGTIINSYAAGSVHTAIACQSAIICSGGLVGLNSSKEMSNSYAEGPVLFECSTQSDYFIGGILGLNYEGMIRRCYAAGTLDSSGDSEADNCVGGFCGEVITDVTFEDTGNFWDRETSDKTASAMGTGKTTTEMMSQSTFAGWDFTTPVWMMLREGEDYPRLAWQAVFDGDIAGLYGVDMADFAYLANYWGLTGCESGTDCGRADVDGSGTVDLPDLAAVANDWLK